MDFNTQNFNNSDEQGGVGQVKSYTCSFCRRGFSNAQALGGHMNIHRRDRAKLKQSSEENLLSLEISTKNVATDHETVDVEEKTLFKLDSGHKKPFTFSDEDNIAVQRGKLLIGTTEFPHLPSFVEEKKADHLDLELRLGLNKPKDSSTLSTRAFF